ncbi:MAG: ATP-dependent helicase [Candidatus Methylomirabilales bacterium]
MRAGAAEEILKPLTDEQREAVTHQEGPLLVIAGAGTGKTTVLTHRIAYLIAAKLAKPSEILALTFTDKAAADMEERVDLLVPYGYAEVTTATFHAFGDMVLREQALALGLRPDFRVLTRPEQAVFFRERLFEFPLEYYRPLGDPTRHVEALLTLISRAKDEDVGPDEFVTFAEGLAAEAERRPDDAVLQEEARRQSEIARTYRIYQSRLSEGGLVDFGDQVLLPLRVLREHPAILAEYRKRFRHILVDEFQDTNYAQWELLKLLAGPQGNLTVVGDDDQSIYKFRGAAIRNILSFTAAYPRAKTVVLRRNHRSSQPILDAAYRLIRHNDPERLEVKQGIDKRLVALRVGERPVVYRAYDTLSAEADAVAAAIGERVASGGYAYRDFAVLVRANRDADPFIRALNMRGIPWRFSGNRGLYGREEIRLLMAFLRTVADPEDSVSLAVVAGEEPYRIPAVDLTLCHGAARRMHRSLHWVLRHWGEIRELGELSEAGQAAIERILKDLERYAGVAQELTTGELLYRFLTEGGLLRRLVGAEDLHSQLRVQNIARFFQIVKRFEEIAILDRVQQFVAYQDALLEAGDDPAEAEAEIDAEAVSVLTVHKAKGLEFRVVFLVGLVADKFPSRGRREPIPLPDALVRDLPVSGDFHLQEERRLFYVGMTRAKEGLYLSSARDYGLTRPKKVSPFVLEALELPATALRPVPASPVETIERFAPRPAESGEIAEAPMAADQVLTLSHYSIDDYRTCPLKYRYIHLLKLPIREHHAVIYGKALHEAVQAYLRRKQRGERMSLEEMRAVFEGAWVSRGFVSRAHEEERLRAGREALRRFHADEERSEQVPAHVEKEFAFVLGRDRVVGRWDRVDLSDAGAVIIDYKSSDIREQKEANRRAKESLQLGIYSLAYREMTGESPARVELRFLESGLVGSAPLGPAETEKTVTAIQEVAAGIRARAYPAKPGYITCGYCAYREICPSAWGTATG